MSLNKETFLEKAINLAATSVLILGITFIVLNYLFPIFPNSALVNYIVGLVIGVFYCMVIVSNNYEDYHNDKFPKIYQIWTLLFPVLFLGSIAVLVYEKFVASSASIGIFWGFGLFLGLTLCLHVYFDEKYDPDEDDEDDESQDPRDHWNQLHCR